MELDSNVYEYSLPDINIHDAVYVAITASFNFSTGHMISNDASRI